MKSEGSLTCSQKPAAGPYPEPDASSPQLPNLLPTLILSSIYAQAFQLGSSLQKFPLKFYLKFSSLPHVLAILCVLWTDFSEAELYWNNGISTRKIKLLFHACNSVCTQHVRMCVLSMSRFAYFSITCRVSEKQNENPWPVSVKGKLCIKARRQNSIQFAHLQ